MIVDQTLEVVTRMDQFVQNTDVTVGLFHGWALGPPSSNSCCQTSGAPATSAKRRKSGCKKNHRDTLASLTQKKLPLSLLALLRPALRLSHLLQLPPHRGRFNQSLQLFVLRQPLTLPARFPCPSPPFHGTPVLTAASGLRERQYWSQSK